MTAAPGLTWSIKTSFIDYVERMPDGVVSVGDGASRRADGTFHFPLASSQDPAVVEFHGSVTCTGHYGMLTVSFADLAILDVDGRRILTCADDDEPGGRREFLDLLEPEFSGALVRFARPVLTQDGADVFFDNYRPGTPFDPVLVVVGADARASAP